MIPFNVKNSMFFVCIKLLFVSLTKGYFGVAAKPYFLRTPQDFSSDVGDSVRLECAASGLPQPDISWTKDDLPVQSGGRFQVGPHNYYPLI